MSHTRRHLIISSRAAESATPLRAEPVSPYDITVSYLLPAEATPEQISDECKRILRKIDAIEHGSE